MRAPGRSAVVLAAAALVMGLLAGCSNDGASNSGGTTAPDAAALLAEAKAQFDAATSAHFVLTSDNVAPDKTALVGGEGVAARPPAFKGDLDVRIGGGTVSVSVISVDGTVYAKLPFASTYQVTDPAALGIGDPATFLDPDRGLGRLFSEMTKPRLGRRARIDGEVVQVVKGSVPGDVVDQVLTSADPAQPVDVELALVKGDSELRRAVLTGPFFAADTQSTFTVVLDRYGDDVQIDAPPTS